MTFLMVLYQLAFFAIAPLAFPLWFAIALFNRRFRLGWKERLGLWDEVPAGSLWVHCASVGEVRAVAPFLQRLSANGIPMLVTTTTTTGREEAAKIVGAKNHVRLLPIDSVLFLHPLLSAKPCAIVIAETEIWPCFLYLAKRFKIPCLMVTARISDKSFPNYLRFKWIFKRVLNLLDGIQAQTDKDYERFIRIGARRDIVAVGGNMKFDLLPPQRSEHNQIALRRSKAAGWKVFVAGSVHPVEASIIGSAFAAIKGEVKKAGFVVAPRHLEKIPEIVGEFHDAGLKTILYSSFDEPLEEKILSAFSGGYVIIVDKFGILGSLYGACDVAFVGGSLVNIGGHNLIEPLNFGVPVLFGPHMQNASDVRKEVLARGIGFEVSSAEDFAKISLQMLDEKLAAGIRKGAELFINSNRGAVEKAISALIALINQRKGRTDVA